MLRVGLVGLGWFGRIHAQVWATVPQAELVAVCDIAPPGSQSFAQDSFHRDPGHEKNPTNSAIPSWRNLSDMLAATSIDLLDICVPEAAHFECAQLGLMAGKHVLVEKPFVLSRTQAIELCALARRKSRHVYVGNILRFDPRYRSIKENIVEGQSNSIRHMSLQRHFQKSAHAVYGRTHPCFGAMIHDIDLALWMTEERPTRVLATERRWLGAEQPDSMVALLEWSSGTTAVVQNAWHLSAGTPYGFSFDSLFLGATATWRVQNAPALEVYSDQAGVSFPEMFFWPQIGDERRGAIVSELRHFASCARENRESPILPVSQALAGVCVAEAMVKSCVNNQWCEVVYE